MCFKVSKHPKPYDDYCFFLSTEFMISVMHGIEYFKDGIYIFSQAQMRFHALYAELDLKYTGHASGSSRLSTGRNATACVLWNVQMRIAKRPTGNFLPESFHTNEWMRRKSAKLQKSRQMSIQGKPIPAHGQASGHGWSGFLNTLRIFWLNSKPAMTHPGKIFQIS